MDRHFTVSEVGPQAQDIPEEVRFAFEGEKVFNDPNFSLQVYELKQKKSGKVTGAVTLNVPDGQGGFRPATGIGQVYQIDEDSGKSPGLIPLRSRLVATVVISLCQRMPSAWIPKPCCG